MTATPRLIVFPGLGLGADVAWPQQALPFEVVGVDYVAPLRGESLADYSARYLDALVADGTLRDPHRTILSGVSFGSAVAQEMSRHWPCAGVALLAGFMTGDEIAGWLHPVAKLARYVPRAVDPLIRRGSKMMAKRIGLISDAEAERVAAMFRAFPLDWLREHARMAVEWPGCESGAPRLRIHGDRDWVVPLRRSAHVDVLLRGDRHLSSISRAAETNDALRRFAERVVPNLEVPAA